MDLARTLFRKVDTQKEPFAINAWGHLYLEIASFGASGKVARAADR